MRRTTAATLKILMLATMVMATSAQADSVEDEARQWVRAVMQGQGDQADHAVTRLRAMGPIGLEALAAQRDALPASKSMGQHQRLDAAMDAVAGQYLGHRSRLYWHTDLNAARTEAAASSKPILSLRLLGKLTDERSCANSRFFRSVLYVDPAVNKTLREQFVLHWSSERPVPQVTIDFGDGRTLKQTIAGNSIHYILDAEGQPVDALPGLFSPQAFLQVLQGARQLHTSVSTISDPKVRFETLKSNHAMARERQMRMWASNLAGTNRVRGNDDLHPDIVRAQVRAMSKAGEVRVIGAMSPDLGRLLADATSDERWERMAERQASLFEISDTTRDLIAAEAKAAGGDPDTMIARFEQTLRIDTMQNMYHLHGSIHEWFAQAEAPLTFDELNTRVYSELFLTPADDPWLGLMPMMTYTAMSSVE